MRAGAAPDLLPHAVGLLGYAVALLGAVGAGGRGAGLAVAGMPAGGLGGAVVQQVPALVRRVVHLAPGRAGLQGPPPLGRRRPSRAPSLARGRGRRPRPGDGPLGADDAVQEVQQLPFLLRPGRPGRPGAARPGAHHVHSPHGRHGGRGGRAGGVSGGG